MTKPVLVIGAGGHATVVVDILRQSNYDILGVVAKEISTPQAIFEGLTFYFQDEDVLSFHKDEVLLVNAIGSLPGNNIRFEIHRKFKALGYDFMTLVSPHSIVSNFATLSEGVHIMPGAIVNANAIVGDGTIVNSGAIVEHDCTIGMHNHLAPGCKLSGGVSTGDFVHVGTGAGVIQGVKIGSFALVGAGVTVTKKLDIREKLYVAKPYLA